MFLWCEPSENFSLFFLVFHAERSEWRIFTGFEDRKRGRERWKGKNWKIFIMLMVSGALWLRLNILKDRHSLRRTSIIKRPLRRLKSRNEVSWEWDVKNAETFFYFSNLYPFSRQLQLLIIPHDIILISSWKVRNFPTISALFKCSPTVQHFVNENNSEWTAAENIQKVSEVASRACVWEFI